MKFRRLLAQAEITKEMLHQSNAPVEELIKDRLVRELVDAIAEDADLEVVEDEEFVRYYLDEMVISSVAFRKLLDDIKNNFLNGNEIVEFIKQYT